MFKFTYNTRIVIFLLLLITIFDVKGKDPTWQIMIDSSEIIAKVEFSTSGDFTVKAEIVELYKGELENKEITISNFSDKDIKMNYIKKGSEYIVFIRKGGELEYKVWSPTAGFLKLDGKNVQYNLLQTTTFRMQKYYPLKDFEQFLKEAIGKDNNHDKFYKKKIGVIKNKMLYPVCAQYVMMLKLANCKKYDPVFSEILLNEYPDSRIALARYLGDIQSLESREIVLNLLNDKDEIVAEEAVNQLINFDSEFAGNVLLRKFKSLGDSTSLKNKNGSINQLKIQLLKSLVQIHYKPAAKVLQPMLSTNNKYLFNLVLESITKLGGKNYFTYLENHIYNKDTLIYEDIFNHILKLKAEEGKYLIMNFIADKNKLNAIDFNYLVSSKGLGIYTDTCIAKFLINDFNLFIDSTIISDTLIFHKWMDSYFDYFTINKVVNAKGQIYLSAQKFINIPFDDINSDSVLIEDKKILIPKMNYLFPLFMDYLSAIGSIDDLLFLQKMSEFFVFDSKNESELLESIALLQLKINDLREEIIFDN